LKIETRLPQLHVMEEAHAADRNVAGKPGWSATALRRAASANPKIEARQ
jgi:hypothetical protein